MRRILAVLIVLSTACASPEGQIRDQLRADGLTDESIDCVIDGLADADAGGNVSQPGSCLDDALTQLFTSEFADLDDELTAAFDDAFSGIESSSPSAAPIDMKTLARQCRAGDNAACDDLWLTSPIDSPGERLAESCGGRSDERRMGSCEFWLE
jgi:hypothetical protein